MRATSSSALPRHSYTAHLRALYHDADDADDEQHQHLDRYSSALDNSQLDTSKDDSDHSSQHSVASTDSIDKDQPYYTLIAHLTQSPNATPTNSTTTQPTTTSRTTPSPTTATLPPPLWPIACDIFDQAERLHRTSHSPTGTGGGGRSFSFLNLLTAHTDVTSSMGLSASSTSLLFSFLVALHRLSLQLGEERGVDWWRLLQAAWVRQCRQDEELRCDEAIRWRLESKRRLAGAADGVEEEEVKEADESRVVQRRRQRSQAVEEVKQPQPHQPRDMQTSPPARRKRKYNALSSTAIELLKLHLHAWRSYAVDQRIAPEVVAQAQMQYCQTVWRRWRIAWLQHRAEGLRLRANRQLLGYALGVWTHWWQRRKLSNAAIHLAQRHHQLFTQSLHLGRWITALHDTRDERHQQQIAVQRHKQLCLPGAIQRWKQYATIKHALHSDKSTAAEWRRQHLAVEALAAWRFRLRGAVEYCQEAAGRLRPVRLRHAVLRWQHTAKAARSAVVSSGPFLHAAFRWLRLSLGHPLPFTTTASTPPSSCLAIRPSRQQSHSAMQQVWRQWQLQRFHTAWRGVVAQHKTERVKLSHFQRLHVRQLLETAWQRWKNERARKEKRKRRLLKQALSKWRERVKLWKATREQLQTAALVHRFNTQRDAFHSWAQHWLHWKQYKQDTARAVQQQLQRDEQERLMEQSMQQQADSFHHNRILSHCLVQWHSYAVHSLVTTCTLTLAASHHSSVCKQWALQRWRQWQRQRRQHQAEQQSLADRADVMYVGRLLSVMLVCWRVQLARKQALRVLKERRDQRVMHERWQRWRTYVQICQQERREQRDAEERRKREDDEQKGQLVVRWRLQAAWTVWRSRMAVIAIGQQLSEKRRQDRMQRVMSGWWDALQQKRQLAEARRAKLRHLLHAYLKHRQDADSRQRLGAELVVSQQGRRRRLAALFTAWKESGLRRVDDARHVAAQCEQLMARRALHGWRTAVQQRKAQLGEAKEAVQRRATAALTATAFQHWRQMLYIRSLYEQLHGRMEDDSADMQLAAFAHWRHQCMSDAWQLWRTESVECRLNRQSEKHYHTVTVSRALSRWSRTARHANQQRQSTTLAHHNHQRRAFAQWRHALANQRQERRAAESLQTTLTSTSLPLVRTLLLSVLRPTVSSVPAVDWFGRWRAYVGHRRRRLEMTTAAYQLYHHNLLAAAFGVMRSEHSLAAQTASFAHSLARHRLTTALHHWHTATTHTRTLHTLAQLTTTHHNSRLATTTLTAWRHHTARNAARRTHCAAVERSVDALVVRAAFGRWRGGVVGVRRRARMFVMGRCFLVWKLQVVRLRERRQLLLADSQSHVASTTQAVAVNVG